MNINYWIGITVLLIFILIFVSTVNNIKNYVRVELIREFEIIEITSKGGLPIMPRTAISLREVETGKIYRNLYIEKRCYGRNEQILVLNNKINLVKIVETHKNTGKSSAYINVSKLCYGN